MSWDEITPNLEKALDFTDRDRGERRQIRATVAIEKVEKPVTQFSFVVVAERELKTWSGLLQPLALAPPMESTGMGS